MYGHLYRNVVYNYITKGEKKIMNWISDLVFKKQILGFFFFWFAILGVFFCTIFVCLLQIVNCVVWYGGAWEDPVGAWSYLGTLELRSHRCGNILIGSQVRIERVLTWVILRRNGWLSLKSNSCSSLEFADRISAKGLVK